MNCKQKCIEIILTGNGEIVVSVGFTVEIFGSLDNHQVGWQVDTPGESGRRYQCLNLLFSCFCKCIQTYEISTNFYVNFNKTIN